MFGWVVKNVATTTEDIRDQFLKLNDRTRSIVYSNCMYICICIYLPIYIKSAIFVSSFTKLCMFISKFASYYLGLLLLFVFFCIKTFHLLNFLFDLFELNLRLLQLLPSTKLIWRFVSLWINVECRGKNAERGWGNMKVILKCNQLKAFQNSTTVTIINTWYMTSKTF